MTGANNELNKGDKDELTTSAQHEVRYAAAPTWTRALQWAIVG